MYQIIHVSILQVCSLYHYWYDCEDCGAMPTMRVRVKVHRHYHVKSNMRTVHQIFNLTQLPRSARRGQDTHSKEGVGYWDLGPAGLSFNPPNQLLGYMNRSMVSVVDLQHLSGGHVFRRACLRESSMVFQKYRLNRDTFSANSQTNQQWAVATKNAVSTNYHVLSSCRQQKLPPPEISLDRNPTYHLTYHLMDTNQLDTSLQFHTTSR